VKICVSFNDSVISVIATRYFTDSGIIGTRAFVAAQYQHFKNLFPSKSDRTPKPVNGLSGMFSLKRLSNPFPLN